MHTLIRLGIVFFKNFLTKKLISFIILLINHGTINIQT